MTIEVCVDCIEAAKVAQAFGAKRVELCSSLQLDGLTPDLVLVRECAALRNIEVHVMIRNRPGDFVYSSDEIQVMRKCISDVAEAGAKGVVFGCLNSNGEVNKQQCKLLLEQAKACNLETTFHRAFDICNDPHDSLNIIINLGFDRLLSSGQQDTAVKGEGLIAELVYLANRRIEIMAGAGIDASNANVITDTGVDALHFTIHDKRLLPINGHRDEFSIDSAKLQTIIKKVNA